MKETPRFNLVAGFKSRTAALVLLVIGILPQFVFEVAYAAANFKTVTASNLINLLCVITIAIFVVRFKNNLEFLSVPLAIRFLNNFHFNSSILSLLSTVITISVIALFVAAVFKTLPNNMFVAVSMAYGSIGSIVNVVALISSISKGALSNFYSGNTGLSLIYCFSGILYTIAIAILLATIKQVEAKETNFKKYLKPIICLLVAIALVLSLVALMHACNPSEPEAHVCMACKGSGEARNDSGFYVTCPRCEGFGILVY